MKTRRTAETIRTRKRAWESNRTLAGILSLRSIMTFRRMVYAPYRMRVDISAQPLRTEVRSSSARNGKLVKHLSHALWSYEDAAVLRHRNRRSPHQIFRLNYKVTSTAFKPSVCAGLEPLRRWRRRRRRNEAAAARHRGRCNRDEPARPGKVRNAASDKKRQD